MSKLPLLTQAERQLLLGWNDTRSNFRAGGVHEWFERQAERTPEAIAVVFEAERLSYDS